MRRARRIGALLMCAAVASACAPRLRPLSGVEARRALPPATLAPGYRRLVFEWELTDPDIRARGEGAARLASPDSARLDFFVAGGLGSGAAVLLGDDLRVPSRAENIARRLVPPAPLLWAALGRLAIPALGDTTARVDGDTLRADIGIPVAWRVTFVGDSLRRVERVDGGRVREWVARVGDGKIRYRDEGARRQLDLTMVRSDELTFLDPDVWTLP